MCNAKNTSPSPLIFFIITGLMGTCAHLRQPRVQSYKFQMRWFAALCGSQNEKQFNDKQLNV